MGPEPLVLCACIQVSLSLQQGDCPRHSTCNVARVSLGFEKALINFWVFDGVKERALKWAGVVFPPVVCICFLVLTLLPLLGVGGCAFVHSLFFPLWSLLLNMLSSHIFDNLLKLHLEN